MTFPTRPEELTCDWLTEVLSVEPGAIRDVTVEFVGDAVGNTSDVYFVRLDVEEGSGLPDSLVAKMIPRFEGAIDVCKRLRLFQREIENYRNVAAHTNIRTPALVWSDFDPETSLGFMLMEDCSHCESLDQTLPVPTSKEQLVELVKASARLHAQWWNPEQLPEGVMTPGNPVRTEFFKMIADGWIDLLGGGEGSETIPDSGKGVATKFSSSLFDLTENQWPTENMTITHHDYRVDNVFLEPGSNQPVVFDWQAASYGKGACDLAYLLATGYEPEFRRKHEEACLQHYYETLSAEGVTGYSMDELRQDYRFGMMFNLWVVPFTAILDLSSERGQALVKKIIGGIFAGIEDHDAEAVLDDLYPA
jgi:hypothetical protein